MNGLHRTLAGALALLLLSACASKPIDTEAELSELTPTEVRRAATSGQDVPQADTRPLLWGGTILGIENRSDGTQLEVLAYPLDRSQRPRPRADAQGRFLVRAADYLEPVDYAKGRLITVLGRLEGTAEGRVGDASYDYPVLASEQIHLWPVEQERAKTGFSFGIGVDL